MTANPILGTGVILCGGLATARYLLPFRAVKGWSYETGWLVAVLAGWLAFPLVVDACLMPDLGAVLASDGQRHLLFDGRGAFLGEWRGTGRRTRLALGFGLLVLLVSFTLMSIGSSPRT